MISRPSEIAKRNLARRSLGHFGDNGVWTNAWSPLIARSSGSGGWMAFEAHPTGDLLLGPPMHNPVDHRLADMREARELS
jgi:hypothetical protein